MLRAAELDGRVAEREGLVGATCGAGVQLDLFSACQRWRGRRPSYRPAGEPLVTSRYEVVPIDFAQAKRYVQQHHYSGSMPASRLQVGLWHKASAVRSESLVGVIVFSVPIQEQAIPAWLEGLSPRLGVELGRMVLDDAVPGNGESWMLGKAFRLLRRLLPEVRGVLSYCDPVERRDAGGNVIKRGHVGTSYRAFGGRYCGRSAPRTLILSTDGRCLSERALSKIRTDEQGAAYALRQLRDLGAPARRPLEDGAAYVERAIKEGGFCRVRHPGNYAFTWRL